MLLDRTIWVSTTDEPDFVSIIDQRYLPHQFIIHKLTTLEETEHAIKEMLVRGAPLIGITAAYGLYLACKNCSSSDWKAYIQEAAQKLANTRPTAVNLFWAIKKSLEAILKESTLEAAQKAALSVAEQLANQDIATCYSIGEHGLRIIESIFQKKQSTVNILTHCNAGWLGCIKYGTATAPFYLAQEKEIPIKVWVDETRPRNQGSNLTAWELGKKNIPYSIIVDNTGGHLMQHGLVDLVFVGADRVTRSGDAANKIGTYLKALAAQDNKIPFYVALPSSTFDLTITDGLSSIPIEERSPEEVSHIWGWDGNSVQKVRIVPENADCVNYGFDVTPARLITGLITERGICAPNEKSITEMFSDLI